MEYERSGRMVHVLLRLRHGLVHRSDWLLPSWQALVLPSPRRGGQRARERAKLTAELIEPGVTLCVVQSPVCWRWAHHLHHLRKSSQGGPDTKENCVPSCDPCNGYIEQNREWARANGWEKERGAA